MPSIMTQYQPLLLLLLHIQLVATSSYINHTGVVPPVAPSCSADQATALLRLKRSFSTTNESMATFRSWRAGTDCCYWEGVGCDHADGQVTFLDLSECGLESGRLDPALFKLTSLEHLNLAYNNFNASQLPSSGFERLVKLTHLNLSSSSFSGEIPACIGHLTSLVLLDLSTGFQILGASDKSSFLQTDSCGGSKLLEPNLEILIANLSKLRELHMGFVDLSNNGAQWCDVVSKSFSKLRVLSLPYCGISGPICTSLYGLRSLAVIDFQVNNLSGPIPIFLTKFTNLSVLSLGSNNFQGWVSPAIFEHKKLVTIDLYRNPGIYGFLPNFSISSSLKILNVGRTNFSGTIPTSISNLKSLKTLGLSATGFSGELPCSIGMLKSLNVLEISGMGIEGSIPSWVANLTSLRALEFSKCGLSRFIPNFLGDLRKLEILVLYKCGFSGEIPLHISNLTQLQTLLIYSTNIVGTVELNSFRKLIHLRALDLSDNNLVVTDGEYNSSLATLPKIIHLYLSGCKMSEFPNFLRHQDEIIWLDLSYNQIHGAIPQWAWETWNNIFGIILANNKFTSVGYRPFLPLLHIWIFDISNNMFKGPIPIPHGYAKMLDYSGNMFSSVPSNFSSHLGDVTLFVASRNNFHGKIPSPFCGATNVQLLDLSYNNFSGSIPPCLMENANGMQSLNLKANQLSGEFPDNINEGCSFEALDFSSNMIAGHLPRSLVACKNLKVVDIGNNQINDSFPCWMSTLHRLEVLVLKSNKFFGHVAQSLAEKRSTCAFPSARIIDLSSNNFSGPLPQDQWFKKLKSMILIDSNMSLVMDHELPDLKETYKYTAAITYKGHATTFQKILRTLLFIDVSDNAFYGSIPEALGELVLLHGLNMSHNSLTGPIPSQLGHLKQLEALDLSSNELSGEIPQGIASLDFLSILDLSYNKLEGRIPESPHFLTFSNSSYLGNNDLCGPPISKGCSNTTTLNEIPHPSKKKSVDIMLFLFVGLGFGVGFAISIVVTWGIPIRTLSFRKARRHGAPEV